MATITLRKRHRVTLLDLPGRGGSTSAMCVTSVTDAMKCIRKAPAITASGDAGAMNVYRQKSGVLRCQFMRFLITHDDAEVESMSQLREWLKKWWPELKR